MIALAGQFLQSSLRERVFASALLYVVAVGLLAPLVTGLALGGPDKALRDVGLGLLWLIGSFVAIWVGVRAIGADLQDGTASLWLARPVSRHTYTIGRFLGVLAVLTAEVALLLAGWSVVAAWHGAPPTLGLLGFALLLWFELALVAAWGMLFSTVASPLPAGLLTAGLWAGGHLADEYVRLAAAEGHPIVRVLARFVFVVVPDLDLFDVQDRVVHGLPLDPSAVVSACAYGAAWTAALVALTGLVLTRRDVA